MERGIRKILTFVWYVKGPIVYYILEGGVGFKKIVVYQNFTPHPKVITYENYTPPLGNNYF